MKCPHCQIEIDEHEAGRETDACVAVVVMGGKETQNFQEKSKSYWQFENAEGKRMLIDSKVRILHLWSPSIDITAAWEVVERLGEKGISVLITLNGCAQEQQAVIAFPCWQGLGHDIFDMGHAWRERYSVDCEMGDMPLAICRAALKAMEQTA